MTFVFIFNFYFLEKKPLERIYLGFFVENKPCENGQNHALSHSKLSLHAKEFDSAHQVVPSYGQPQTCTLTWTDL
jgi:hypothetical protein